MVDFAAGVVVITGLAAGAVDRVRVGAGDGEMADGALPADVAVLVEAGAEVAGTLPEVVLAGSLAAGAVTGGWTAAATVAVTVAASPALVHAERTSTAASMVAVSCADRIIFIRWTFFER